MNASDFISAGYKVSTLIAENEINKAVSDVTECYINRVLPSHQDTDADVKAAVLALAFILLCRRSVFATRAGGKEKLSPAQSSFAMPTQYDYDNADRLLKVLQRKEGGVSGSLDRIVDDICEIYFKTAFFGKTL